MSIPKRLQTLAEAAHIDPLNIPARRAFLAAATPDAIVALFRELDAVTKARDELGAVALAHVQMRLDIVDSVTSLARRNEVKQTRDSFMEDCDYIAELCGIGSILT